MLSLEDKLPSECDVFIKEELGEAGISVVEVPQFNKVVRGVVPARFIGVKNSFIFVRYWYFYQTSGVFPLSVIPILQQATTDCRINGNYEAWTKNDFVKLYPFASYVPYFQIDSVDGLKAFVKVINENQIYGDTGVS